MSESRADCSHSNCGRCAARTGQRVLLATPDEIPLGCPNAVTRDAARPLVRSAWYGGVVLSRGARGRLAAVKNGARAKRAAELVESRQLVLCRTDVHAPVRAGSLLPAPDVPIEPVLAAPPVETETTWVEFRMVDEVNEPVPNLRYRVVLPDGREKQGRLDSYGRVRFNDLDEPGECVISFPDLDADAWEPLE